MSTGIVLLSTTLGWGGTEGEAVRLACEYARRGLSPSFIVDEPPLHRLPVLEKAGITVTVLGVTPDWSSAQYRAALADAMTKADARVLHGHVWERIDDILATANKLNVPAALTMHTTISRAWRFRLGLVGNPMRYARWRRAYAEFDPVVIGISDLSDANFRVLHPRVTRTRRIYYGAETPPEPVDVHTGGDGPQVLWVGSFTSRKRPLWALEAWARVLAKHPNAHLAMIGDGPQMDDAKRVVKNLPPSSVTLVGNTPDVPDYLHRSQILLHTALREGIPTVVIQAVNYGLPIVACNAGAMAEAVVEGQSGYLTGFDEMDKVADRLGALIDDPTKRAAMGKAARTLGERTFGLERYVDETLSVYTDLCGLNLSKSATIYEHTSR